ncbi:MAG: hypothetical protein AB1921_02595, partial [Thermodesulfobacteriota bacterium]
SPKLFDSFPNTAAIEPPPDAPHCEMLAAAFRLYPRLIRTVNKAARIRRRRRMGSTVEEPQDKSNAVGRLNAPWYLILNVPRSGFEV